MGIYGEVSLRIDHVFADPVSCFHQSVQILPGRMHLNPSRVVFLALCFCEPNCFQSSLVINLLVTPDAVRPHVGAVEICLGWVEYHSMDCRLVAVFVVLDVFLQRAVAVDAEDVAIAGVVVERVAVDIVRGLAGRKEENGARFGVSFLCFRCDRIQQLCTCIQLFQGSPYHVRQFRNCPCARSRSGCPLGDCSISSCSRRRCSPFGAVWLNVLSAMDFQ